jgi:hypothetical protein
MVVALSACTLSPAAPPPADPSTQPHVMTAAELTPGTHVQVARQGQWYGASILQATADGRFLIHYDSTGNEYNEPVTPDRIKPFPAPTPARDYRAGEKVLVTFQNRLLLGEIVAQVAPDSWTVHYDGFGAEGQENVGSDRMRRPFVGTSAHAVGESLIVDVSGQTVGGKVIAVSAADHWLVRFEKFGPQYDQEVGVERIKGAPPPVVVVAPVVAPPVVAVAPPVAVPLPVPAKPAPVIVEKPKKVEVSVAPQTGPQAGPPSVGETVLVHEHGAWFMAAVTEVNPTGVKVKYPSGGDGVASMDRVVREPGSLRGIQYAAGQLVLVEYKGIYVAAKVLRPEGKDYKVRFDGQGPGEDEVIASRRLRPR